MLDDVVTPADLLERWRDATRAAELANRLARVAEEASTQAELDAASSEEIAVLAERAAAAADQAARTAREAADRAAAKSASRDNAMRVAQANAQTSDDAEGAARDAYRDAEGGKGSDRPADDRATA
jgi:hypothetical protein